MTFLKEEKLKKKNKFVEEYLNNRKLLKKGYKMKFSPNNNYKNLLLKFFFLSLKKLKKLRRKQMKGKTN